MVKLAPADILKQVIVLDFKKYWGCNHQKLTIATILHVQRYGYKIDKLPAEVQEILRSPEVREAWDMWYEERRTLQPTEQWNT